MAGSDQARPIEILLVEDDVGDELMTRAAFELGSIANPITTARDGFEAIECMRRHPPDLVLLDLILPRQEGAAVLDQIRRDPSLAATPVIALTTSEPEIEVWRRRGLPADGFLAKPVDVERFLSAVREIDGLLLQAVRKP